MDESPDEHAPPVSWKKLALIPVLGGVLWYVLNNPSEEVAVPTLVVTTPQVTPAPASVPPASNVQPIFPQSTSPVAPGSVAPVPFTTADGTGANSPGTALPMSLPLQQEMSRTHTITWPSTPLAEVMAINPFQLPPGLLPLVTTSPSGPATEPESSLSSEDVDRANAQRDHAIAMQAALKQHRLTALVQTSRGIGAIVGDTVVTVGDTLGDRFRISAIRPDGLVLEWIAEPPETGLLD